VTGLSGIEAVPYDFDLVRACSNWFSGLGAGASSRESAVITNKIATITRTPRASELLYGWRIIGVWRWWRLNVRSLLMMPETTA
jgi:hypothetical protein